MKINRNLWTANTSVLELKVQSTETSDDDMITVMHGEYNTNHLIEFPFIAKLDNGIMVFVTGYDPEEDAYSGSFTNGSGRQYVLDLADGIWGLSITDVDKTIKGDGTFQ